MRVITGTARGRKLKSLEGREVHPTTDRVKEAVFSILQWEISGAAVLDLFAGSGQLGIEALSRGAGSCVFVDASARAASVVRENLRATGLMEKATLLTMDSFSYLKSCRCLFDIILLDPPYHSLLLEQTLPLLSPFLSPRGVVLCETTTDCSLSQTLGGLTLKKEYRYGKIKLYLYRGEGVE